MAFFYNDDAFRQAGVDATKITTWDDYYEAAKKLKNIGVYIAADAGDASFYNAMIWLAGGRPFHTSSDGKTVTVDLKGDAGTRTFTEFWQRMIDEGLVNTHLKSLVRGLETCAGWRVGRLRVRRSLDAVAAAGRRAGHIGTVARHAHADSGRHGHQCRERRLRAGRAAHHTQA